MLNDIDGKLHNKRDMFDTKKHSTSALERSDLDNEEKKDVAEFETTGYELIE